MTYRLYGRRQTGSMVVEAALAITGADWTMETVAKPQTPSELASLEQINPRGQVPILIHPDGTVITEGPAILLHLADAFPAAGLAPAPGSSARAWHDRWLAFFHANIYEGMLRELFPDRYTTDPMGASAVQAAATAYVQRHFLILEAEVSRRGLTGFFCGTTPSMLDLYVWMLCFWLDATWLEKSCPRLFSHWQRMRGLNALAPVEATHFG